jgi:hypothetical protein
MKDCPYCAKPIEDEFASRCPHCRHELKTGEVLERRPVETVPPQRVIITGIQMPFGDMVWFLMKWTLAAIPAVLVVGLIFGLFFARL